MRGLLLLWQRSVATLLVLCVTIAALPVQTASAAVQPLVGFRPVISNISPSKTNVAHDITFTIPTDANQLRATDYIVLTFTNFSAVLPPNGILGVFGNPNMFVSGNKIYITAVQALPGTLIRILGITATNPDGFHSFLVTASICGDHDCTLLRNQSTAYANEGDATSSVYATVESPLASAFLSGFTSPSAFVTVTETGTVYGTTTADPFTGAWSISLSAMIPTTYTFAISASDVEGRNTSQVTENVTLSPRILTSITGIMLSPTIQLDRLIINAGDQLTVFGAARPSSVVNIVVESPASNYSTVSDATGHWSYILTGSVTSTFRVGQYRSYANVQDESAYTSIFSNTVNFTVGTPVDATNPPPKCNISRGDLNCDGKINLTDLSILLFHWASNHKVADINNDGKVNLTDFSIMMANFKV